MKTILTLLCTILFLQIASAQSLIAPDPQNGQSLWQKYTTKYFNPWFVVDDKLLNENAAKNTLDDIDPWSVTKVLVAHRGSAQPRDVVYITTGRTKINAYQQKFAKFSAKYAAYLKAHKYWDGRFMYMLNGKGVSGSTKDIINILYNTPAGQILRVDFSEEQDNTAWNVAIVRIATT